MKKFLVIFLSLSLFGFFSSMLTRCSVEDPGKHSETLNREYVGNAEIPLLEDFEKVTIYDMTLNAENFAGTFVITSGKVVSVCPVGCYFFMHDVDGNQVYVDLAPQNFDIPQSALNQMVEVWGLGSMMGGAPKISAYKVIFTDIKESAHTEGMFENENAPPPTK